MLLTLLFNKQPNAEQLSPKSSPLQNDLARRWTQPALVTGKTGAFTINHLTGRARLWGTAEWDQGTSACSSFRAFSAELKKVFDVGTTESESSLSLLQLKQGKRSVSDYSVDFRTLARQSNWNPPALHSAFLHGLSDYMKDELAVRDLPDELDEVIFMAIRVDQRIQARRQERSQKLPNNQTCLQSTGLPSPGFLSLVMVQMLLSQLSPCRLAALDSPLKNGNAGNSLTFAFTVGKKATSCLPVQQKSRLSSDEENTGEL